MGNMAPNLTPMQYDLIYNCASLGLASMGASTAFFFLRLPSFHEKYKTALCITGLVTFIAMYHYMRIFNSFEKAYTPCFKDSETGEVNYNLCNADEYGYSPTGIPFNDAYRYIDWLLTVPMLLTEIILVMGLEAEETRQRIITLGASSALMIIFGYPGETSGEPTTRWLFWCISMVPFCYIVYTLFVGLKEAQEAQLPEVKGLGKTGLTAQAITAVQIGYTVSDIISKCGVGFLVYKIGLAKSYAANSYTGLEEVKADPPPGPQY